MESYCLTYSMLLCYIRAITGKTQCVVVDHSHGSEYVCDLDLLNEMEVRQIGIQEVVRQGSQGVRCVLTKRLLKYSSKGVGYISGAAIENKELIICGRVVSVDDVLPWMIEHCLIQ